MSILNGVCVNEQKNDVMLEIMKQDIKMRIHDIYDQVYRLLSQEGYNQPKNRLIFEVNDSEEVNGYVYTVKDKDCVHINVGVISCHLNYFNMVNKLIENRIKMILLSEKDDALNDDMSYEGIWYRNERPIYVDSKRMVKDRTGLLEIFASRFILLHELGHLFNGHYLYLVSKGCDTLGRINMHYGDETIDDANLALTYRTLEMDADMFAVTQSIYHLFFLMENFDTEVDCMGMEPMDLFYWWGFAIRSHFLLYEKKYGDSSSYSKYKCHLPSNVRWLMAIETAVSIINNNINKTIANLEAVMDKIAKGAHEAEKDFNEINSTSYSWLNDLKNVMLEEYEDEVNQRWEEIVEELGEFSRAPLYIPNKN